MHCATEEFIVENETEKKKKPVGLLALALYLEKHSHQQIREFCIAEDT